MNSAPTNSYYPAERPWDSATESKSRYWGSSAPVGMQNPESLAPRPAMRGAMRRGEGEPYYATSWSPDVQQWVYLDPNGQIQGPFSATAMQSWYEHQYLYMDLPVRREEEANFRPLYAVIQEMADSSKPFLVPPRQQAPAMPRTSGVPGDRPDAYRAAPTPPAASHVPGPDVSHPAPDGSTEDLAITLRVMKQLEAMLITNGAPEAQITQVLENAFTTGMPSASAAQLDEVQSAMRAQRKETHPAEDSIPKRDVPIVGPSATEEPTVPVPRDDTPAETPAPKPEKMTRAKRAARARAAAEAEAANGTKPTAKDTASAPPAPTPAQPTAAPQRAAPTEPLAAHQPRAAAATEPAPARRPTPEPKAAPWAAPSAASSTPSAPNLREILEREERERAAQLLREKAAASARVAQGTVAPPTGLPQHAPSGAPWSIPSKASSAKSLAQIQQEESALAQRTRAAQPQRTGAYSNSALRGASATEPAHQEAWTKVGAQGKAVPAPTPRAATKPVPKHTVTPRLAPVAQPTAAAAPEWSEVQDGWVTKKGKGQARRGVMSQMNDAIPVPTGAAAGLSAPRRETTASSQPLPPSAEFLRTCREQLRDLRANVDDFMDMLLTFPLNPSKDTEEIIAEAVYANSSTLDGRRFASEFVQRRRQDAYRAVAL